MVRSVFSVYLHFMGQILGQHGKPIQKEESVWMSFEEVQAQKQLELRQIAQMFPTLKGFLWDIEPKQPDHAKTR